MGAPRWSFAVPTPLGVTRSSYELTDSGLRFVSDDVFGGSEEIAWRHVAGAATAAMPGMGGAGLPDFPDWLPERIEWLVVARNDGGEPFMRILPQGADHEALVAALQSRLGSRWVGTRLALKDAHARLGIVSGGGNTLKVIAIVVAVLALLVLLVLAIGLLLHPIVVVPAGALIGAWFVRKGVTALRQADVVAAAPKVPIARATPGPVVFQGRAFCGDVTPAAVSGRPCKWWDVSVEAEYVDDDNHHSWQQIASRHAGRIDVIDIDDGSARVPVWLHGAQLVLATRSWESHKDELPAHGLAFVESLGFAWRGEQNLRITETCLAADGPLYVVGRLDARSDVTLPPAPTGVAKLVDTVRSGRWRRPLVASLPPPLRVVAAVLIGYLDMLTSIGTARDREPLDPAASMPTLPPAARMVWQGRDGGPFVVSDHAERDALAGWRRRSKWQIGIGVAVWVITLFTLAEAFGA